jgi:hypothetical protein
VEWSTVRLRRLPSGALSSAVQASRGRAGSALLQDDSLVRLGPMTQRNDETAFTAQDPKGTSYTYVLRR